MSKLFITGNDQCTITIPKELVKALKWEKGDEVLISKAPGQDYIIIENVSKKERGE